MSKIASYSRMNHATRYANEIMRKFPNTEAFPRLLDDGSFRYGVAVIPKGTRLGRGPLAWALKRPPHYGATK